MPARPPLSSIWVKAFVTWLSYVVSGLLAAWLSAPAEAAPLYLAAGVGLACVLGWGRWMLLPVGLGGLTVGLAFLLLPGGAPPGAADVAWAAAGGVGAALQAWAGHRLAQLGKPLCNRPPLTLDTPREILVFMGLTGPVACVIHPLVLTLAHLAADIPLPNSAGMTFAGLWASHTLGTLLAAPMVLTLVGQPRSLWRSRRELVGVPMLLATVLLVLAVRQVQVWRVEREGAVFNQDVNATANAVTLRLNGFLDALAALNGVFEGSAQVSREEFARASRYWIEHLHGIQAVGWNERVPLSELPAFEARQRAEGLRDYKVFSVPHSGAAARPEAVVVRYVEPLQDNIRALGFDILSRPESRDAYDQASREGRAIATRGFQLVQSDGGQMDVVVYTPVSVSASTRPGENAQPPDGVVFLALRMQDALAVMLQARPTYLDACLVDATERQHPVLAGSAGCVNGNTGEQSAHRASVPIEFAGRRWELVIWNSAPVPLIGQEATTWLLAVGGAAFAAALGSLLLVMTGHTRRVEEAMEEARRQRAAAETANRAKSEFLSRMSHELRTPLNAVLGFAQLMEMDRRDVLPPAHLPRVEQIQQAGWHLLDMIDDVLDISRIETGTLRLQAEPLHIRDELATAVKLMQADAARQGVEVILPNDIPSEWGVMADAARLRQIIGNLLSNAIKFNKRGGQVRLQVTRIEGPGGIGTLHIAIEDTGIGMSPQQLHQLFQPFNRLGREQTAIGGTGIGLVVGRHLTLLMGGQIEARSVEDEGSVFTLSMPALTLPPRVKVAAPSPDAPATPPPASEPAVHTEPKPRHVLYVEDNLANSEVIRSALAARPWVTVSVAPTTEEGLAVLHNRLTGRQPDLILLDVHLPDASGLELLKLIKANPDTAGIPVIMISADAVPEHVDAALAAGACCYLTKPVQLSELLRQVDELMPA